MKKRDYIILGFLICVVLYAASHRNEANASKAIPGKCSVRENNKAVILENVTDSIKSKSEKIIKAGI